MIGNYTKQESLSPYFESHLRESSRLIGVSFRNVKIESGVSLSGGLRGPVSVISRRTAKNWQFGRLTSCTSTEMRKRQGERLEGSTCSELKRLFTERYLGRSAYADSNSGVASVARRRKFCKLLFDELLETLGVYCLFAGVLLVCFEVFKCKYLLIYVMYVVIFIFLLIHVCTNRIYTFFWIQNIRYT